MNTDATYNPQLQDDNEEEKKHLALLIHQAGEDARIRTKKILDDHFKKLNNMIAEAVLSQKNPSHHDKGSKTKIDCGSRAKWFRQNNHYGKTAPP